MSIGKSSIQRAANNGYSNVKSTAPDMENSVVAEEKVTPVAPVTPVEEKAVETTKKPAAKKPVAKKSAPKKACVKTANKAAEKATRLGDEMPYFLL